MPEPFGPYGFSISVLLISIMLSVSGILLGLGYALDDKRLREFGKSELYQAIINGMLVGGFLVLFVNNGVVTTLINSLTASSGAGFSCSAYMAGNAAICFAYNYLAGLSPYVFSGGTYSSPLVVIGKLLTALMALAFILGMVAGMTIRLPVFSFSLSAALNPVLVSVQHVITLLSASMLSVLVQVALLSFISIAAVSILLPLGIVLRTFYPTRKLGGFFIATSVGLYVVFPLSYLLNAYMLSSYSMSMTASNLTTVTAEASALESQLTEANSSSISFITSSSSSLVSDLSSLINKLLSFLSGMIVQVFILPTFSLIITAISIREIARMLGSEAFFGKLNIL